MLHWIFILLSGATVLFCIEETVYDIAHHDFTLGSVGVILFLGLVAGVFAFLAWFFDGKLPEGRAPEPEAPPAEKKQSAYRSYPPALKRRIWKFRFWGAVLIGLCLWICIAGGWDTLPVSVGTVLLIFGIAVWSMGSPGDYNALTEDCGMLALDRPCEIREFYEVYKEVPTALGSGWLGKLCLKEEEALIFGPDGQGQFLYFYLSGDGLIGYVGQSSAVSQIERRITKPIFAPSQDISADPPDIIRLRQQLQRNLEQFVKTGVVAPFQEPAEDEEEAQ